MSQDHWLGWALFCAALLPALLRAATPILLAALGGLVSELAGCINVALEGIMLMAAFAGVIVCAWTPHWFPGLAPLWHPWIGCAAGLFAAVLLAGTLALFHLEWGADPIVAGIAINILAAGLTVFLLGAITGDKGSTASLASAPLPVLPIPGLRDWPVADIVLNGENRRGHHILIYLALLAVPLLAWLLRATRWGLWLRAAGENPAAAAAAGINVKRMRYLAVLLSGALAGLGGIFLSMGHLTLFQADMSAGRGFLALAAIFLGARRLPGVLGASLLFGAATVLATQLGASRLTSHIAPQLLYMLPPLVTLAALSTAGWRRARQRR